MSCTCSCSRTFLNGSSAVNTATTRAPTPRTNLCARARNPSFHSLRFGVNFVARRTIHSSSLPPNATTFELPLLPFNTNEVLVPSESKTLHLYEARYLALLEESLSRKKFFVHFVLDPILISNSGTEASFAARYGCLVHIENLKRLDVGALISIRGISRVKIVTFVQSEPYMKGEVIPMHDRVAGGESNVNSKVAELREALYSLNSLEIKLKAPKDALLQTRIANSLAWAENALSLEVDEAFLPSLAERVSFAALQPVTGCSESEMYSLQQKRLRAMDVKETLHRINDSLEFINQNISMVAAKLAIQTLGMQ